MKFKKGDKIKRISGEHMGMEKGDIATIRELNKYFIFLEEYEGGHNLRNFELVKMESIFI